MVKEEKNNYFTVKIHRKIDKLIKNIIIHHFSFIIFVFDKILVKVNNNIKKMMERIPDRQKFSIISLRRLWITFNNIFKIIIILLSI